MWRKAGLPALAVGLAAAASAATPAFAEERSCRGVMGAIKVDDLRVPDGASCRLNGTRIEGSLRVERRATLNASRIRVVGNVHAEGAAAVNVAASRIGGRIDVVQSGRSRLNRTVVGSDVQYFENRGSIRISRNRIDGNLQCKANSPAPRGGRNVVQGNKEDQCSRL
jgi:hypothetical protein